MSKRAISLVSVSGVATLEAFANSVASKAGASVSQGPAQAGGANISIGAKAPAGVHTAITKGAGSGAYSGVNTTIVRAVLPEGNGPVAVRDAVDVLPGAGINSQNEMAAAKASFAKTAAQAVSLAKATPSKKITVAVKQVSKYNNLNELFNEAVTEAAESAGVAVDLASTATVANNMVMFPESLGVVATADTPTADNLEGALSGLLGGAARTYVGDEATVYAGNSTFSVARAVAGALGGAEAKKIEAAVAKAKANDGASVLSGL